MSGIAFVFPGQGSQKSGMGKDFYEAYTVARNVFDEANRHSPFSITDLIFNGEPSELTKTQYAQPALLTTSVAIYEVLIQKGITPDVVAGHSLGEYSALVATGSISFSECLELVIKRGQLMSSADPEGKGGMAAVLGLNELEITQVLEPLQKNGHKVQVANYNCPGQIVISGEQKAINDAGILLKEAGAKRVLPLQVSGPFHSELMMEASQIFVENVERTLIHLPQIPTYSNVTAQPYVDEDAIKRLLVEQIYSSVRFTEMVENMVENGIHTFIEVGPGNVLGGLIKKINPNVAIHSISTVDGLNNFLESWEK